MARLAPALRLTMRLFAPILALAAIGCGGPKYYIYDEYLNKEAQAKVNTSKNVWVSTSDYNADLIIVELKQKGFTIDAAKADFSMSLTSDVCASGMDAKQAMMTLTFMVRDVRTRAVIFSKVGMYTAWPTNVQVREFIHENLAVFQGSAT
jgi:hypothetical protein